MVADDVDEADIAALGIIARAALHYSLTVVHCATAIWHSGAW